MRPLTMCLVLPVFLGCGVWAEFVRSAQAAEYIYDDLGRLQAATDDPVAGSTAVWTYDPVGNLTGIVRQSATTLSIIDFSPKCGLPGGQVTISGSGYSPVSAQNTVTFNSLATGIMTATPTQLVVTIPGGPSSGLLTVTTPTGSTTSSQP
ncbi:MAG: IPT/TIG domain-containing protein, partial [Candidatus Binatia bacterium]